MNHRHAVVRRARLRLLLPLVLVVALAGCEWGQWGFDASQTGFDPVEPGLTTANVSTLTPRWSRPVWRGVAAGDGSVFAITPDPAETLVALDPATGAIRWQSASANLFAPPVIVGDTVYTSVSSGGPVHVNAYDAATGNVRWSVTDANCPLIGHVPLTVADGVVLAATDDGKLCALGAQTGGHLWVDPAAGVIDAPPALAGGRVFSVGAGPSGTLIVRAHDAALGTSVWSHVVAGQFTQGGPAVAGGRVFVPAGTRLLTFDTATGTAGWTGPAAQQVSAGGGVVVVADGVGVESAPSSLRALDPVTGAERWSVVGPNGLLYSKPAIASGMLFVGSFQETDVAFGVGCCSHVSARRLDTGGQLFSFSTEPPGQPDVGVFTRPIVSNGAVYLDADGITALRPTPAP